MWLRARAGGTAVLTLWLSASVQLRPQLSTTARSAAQSWSSAASLFREKVSESQWQSAAASARAPLGALKTRTLLSATPKSALPGAPDGRYVVIQFASSFEHQASAIETVTPMMDAEGKWHVAAGRPSSSSGGQEP